MATEKTSGPLAMQEPPEEDECNENVPPEPSGTSFKISTPAPASSNFGCKVKSQVTGLQSALSPIVKHLSNSNKYLSLGPPKLDCNPLQSVPLYSFGTTGTSTAANWLYDETLPEITLLNDTCDLTMPLKDNDPVFPISAPPTPLTAKCGNSELSNQRERTSWVGVKDFPEITLVDVTHDSEPSPAEKKSPKEVTRDIQASSSDLGEPDAGRLNVTHTEESLVSCMSSDKCVRDSTMKMSLEETRDVTMDNSKSSSEPNGQTMDLIQTSTAGDASAGQPSSIGCSRNQSDLSVPLCTSDIECKTAALEEPDEPMEISGAVKNDTQIPQSCCDPEITSVVTQPSQSAVANDTITLPQASDLTASVVLNSTAVVSSPQNKTLDLPESAVAAPETDCDATQQMSSLTTETPPVVKTPSSPAVQEGESCDVQNGSAESLSLQKSSDGTQVGGAIDLKNNTFECQQSSKQNVTITLSESSSSDSLQKTLEKPPSPKVCNLTTSIKESLSELQTSEKSLTVGAAEDQTAKKSENPEETFEANPVAEVSSEAGKGETKDQSQSSLRAMDGLSDSLNHQSVNSGNRRVSGLNLEESLDLRMDCLVTSTPITTGKLFSVIAEREEGKNPGAQKKLYVEGPGQPAAQVPPDIPSNLIGDRKTFLKQPPQLLRYKAASALSGRLEPMTSGLPVTRQRAHATEAALRNPGQDAPKGLSGVSSSYNLRATATGSKPPISRLLPPKQSGIPSGNQRAAPGVKLPSARGNALALPPERLGGPAACIPVTRGLQAKRHLLTRVELLPSSKRQKTDPAVPPSSAESSTCTSDTNKAKSLRQPTSSQRGAKTRKDDAAAPSSGASSSALCDAGSRVRGLKAPVTTRRAVTAKVQGPGCANCASLEKEIKRLNEELLKYKRQEEKPQESKRSQS